MPESDLHSQLVDRIVGRLVDDRPQDYFLFVDGRSAKGKFGIPPRLETVRPDVFARHVTSKIAIIGEAKTYHDIDNPHTELQLMTFFSFLASEGNGELHLAVPWNRLDEMLFVAKRTQRMASAKHIPFSVTGWVLADTDFFQVRRG